MSYRIFTDATSDLPATFAEQLQVSVLPMGFTMEEKEYFYIPGRSDMPIETFFEKMRTGIAVNTAQVNAFTFLEAFEPVLKNGEDVLYIGFSSKLSGTVQSAFSAAEELSAKYPDRKIFVIDSCCASLGEGLLVYYAARKRDLSVEALAKWVEENKLRFVHWFTVDDLVYLKRGGRISGATAAIATILNIKPVMHVDNEGYLVATEKVQGRKKSLRALFDHMEKNGRHRSDRHGIHRTLRLGCGRGLCRGSCARSISCYDGACRRHRHQRRRAFRPRHHSALLPRQRAINQTQILSARSRTTQTECTQRYDIVVEDPLSLIARNTNHTNPCRGLTGNGSPLVFDRANDRRIYSRFRSITQNPRQIRP